MSTESEYNALLAKYNRLVSRFKDVTEQAEERQAKWKELEKQFRINESVGRDLCELILAKDPSEMVLGKEYSWGKLSFFELISKAKVSFERYNSERTELMQKIQEQSEERRNTIESLEAQIFQMKQREKDIAKARGESSPSASDSEPENNSTASADAQEEVVPPSVPESTLKRVNYNTQQAAKSGKIDVCLMEEDEDVTQADIAQQAAAARISTAISVEKQGYKVSPSKKKKKVIEEVRKKEEQRLVHVDANELKERMTDRRWYILEVIGTYGFCEGSEITDYVLEHYDKSDSLTENGVRYEIKNLVTSGCLLMDNSIEHPLKSRFAVYSLSDIGRRLYADHFGKEPVLSERDLLIAQHDNLEHGIGIKCLKSILEKSGGYETVSMDRKDNTIILDDNAKYIPDIKATGKTKNGRTFTAYFEYERGTHSQSDFNVKLNRMTKVTRVLNIVCPNALTVEDLVKKVKKWVELRGGNSRLSDYTVRLTTLIRLNGQANINNDDNWQAVFKLRNSAEPIQR